MSLHLDIISGLSPLILNEFILLGHPLRLSLSDLLLTELSLIVVIFTHSVQVVLDLLLLSSNFLDSGHLLIDEVFVTDCELLFLFFLALALGHSLLFFLSLSILLFSSPLENDVVVLSLQVLQLPRLFLRFSDLFHGAVLLVLEHADTVAQQVNVSLELEADRASLIIG